MAVSVQLPPLETIKEDYIRSDFVFHRARQMVDMDLCTLASQNKNTFQFVVEDRFEDYTVTLTIAETLQQRCRCASMLPCCHHAAAALIALHRLQEEKSDTAGKMEEGERYGREEMIQRVLQERRERANSETYSVTFSDNVYGIHRLQTAANREYELTIRNFDPLNGYCSCPDFRTNKLGTCKHLIYLHKKIRDAFPVKKLTETQSFPFVEIYCDPLQDYQITYFYKGGLPLAVASLLEKYFQKEEYLSPERYGDFLEFIKKAEEIKKILIRPEVTETIDRYFEDRSLQTIEATHQPDFSGIKADLLPYQKDGVLFALYKRGAIIADDMGLGKTLQGIAVAALKKEIFGFRRVLVVCPASLKYQWKKEIERFCDLPAVVIEGNRNARREQYQHSEAYFLVTNYMAVLRDIAAIRQNPPDMIILDEAQRIKNYETKTSYAVKAIPKKHSLVLTGTPIENRLGDLYSIMNFIDPRILAPLWEFSMQHCYFDKSKKNRITGYYNLQALRERLAPWVIRREKETVLEQLPPVQEITVPVNLHPMQQEIHANLARGLAPILAKKHKTLYDMQRIQQILTSMRMVCDSSFLVDRETNFSPKLAELQEILLEGIDLSRPGKKVIVFSEWKLMLDQISRLLRARGIGHRLLTGDVPVRDRAELIDGFESDPDCKVLLASEAGGTGLNLQFADTVINFELPWNPARKNQRIGRIHRIGQKSPKITAINLVARNSIEERIQSGIELKESLFEAVLKEGNLTDEVDFAKKGRSMFLDQVKQLVEPFKFEDYPEQPAAEPAMPVSEERQLAMFEEDQAAAGRPAEREETPAAAKPAREAIPSQAMQDTLQQGMAFLGGLMKMATGKDLPVDQQSISVDPKTGEVVMRFKMPVAE